MTPEPVADAAATNPSSRPDGARPPADATPPMALPSTRWGRVRFGSRRLSSLVIALPGAAILATALGLVAVWAGLAGPHPLAGGLAFALCMCPVSFLIIWAPLVDRSTMTGATRNPEQTIETVWLHQASFGALTDTFVVASLGAGVLSLAPSISVNSSLALLAVACFIPISLMIRFYLLRRRG